MQKIGFIGDSHGSAVVVNNTLDRFRGRRIKNVIHVGDFGFWPGVVGESFIRKVDEHLAKNGQTLYVTPGNHEDYNFIDHLYPNEDGWLVAADHILVAPRGYRWEWDGVSFVSLGGAPSVDRAWRLDFQRKNGYPVWWKQEAITEEDVERTVAGGHAEIMICHDAPLGVPAVEKGIEGNPMGFTDEDLEYAEKGRTDLRRAVEGVQPDMLFHGHYHWRVEDILELDDGKHVEVFGLASDGAPSSWGVLDLTTREFEFGLGGV